MEHMDPEKFKSQMHSLAYGSAMMAAAQDYQKEMLDAEAANRQHYSELDIAELQDDPDLEAIYADRLASMQKEAEKRAKKVRQGFGELSEIKEEDFLETVTKADFCACHFYHRDFERCKLLDRHLAILCRRYPDTRFIRISAPDAPFFTVKLQIKVLPCMVLFCKGVAMDRVVGFDDFGGKDDFSLAAVERRLLTCGVVKAAPKNEDSDDDLQEHVRRSVHVSKAPRTASDEDSDFGD